MKLAEIAGSEIAVSIGERLAKLDRQTQAFWAADAAEHVLHFFEDQRPGDTRPRQAIEAARAWARGEIKCGAARKAALASHSAARESKDDSAIAAARAAGHAAATAHVPRHSNGAGHYAAKAVFHHAGPEAMEREREWQLRILIDISTK